MSSPDNMGFPTIIGIDRFVVGGLGVMAVGDLPGLNRGTEQALEIVAGYKHPESRFGFQKQPEAFTAQERRLYDEEQERQRAEIERYEAPVLKDIFWCLHKQKPLAYAVLSDFAESIVGANPQAYEVRMPSPEATLQTIEIGSIYKKLDQHQKKKHQRSNPPLPALGQETWSVHRQAGTSNQSEVQLAQTAIELATVSVSITRNGIDCIIAHSDHSALANVLGQELRVRTQIYHPSSR